MSNEEIVIEAKKISDAIMNIPLDGDKSEIEKMRVMLLDLYVRENIDYANEAVLELETARMNHDKGKELKALQKYGRQFKPVGFFEDKLAVCGNISWCCGVILRQMGIEANCLDGNLINADGEMFGHRWNEVKIGEEWYCYDYTHNMVNENMFKLGYEVATEYMVEPITSYDYSFTARAASDRYLGGFNDKHEPDKNLVTNDFSKYTKMDRNEVNNIYNKAKELYTKNFDINTNKKTL